MHTISILLGLLLLAFTSQSSAQEVDCSCGYRDPDSLAVYTETLILYFNETDTIDGSVFVPQNYAHKTEHGWDAIFREGANPQNALLSNDAGVWHANRSGNFEVQSLELITEPSTADHLVIGGNLQSARRDIQYGSFRAGMKSATQWTGGTALTLALAFNSSQSLEMDLMNMDDPSDATLTNLVNGEWPEITGNLTTNYTKIHDASGVNPWTQFVDLRMDWNATNVDFWAAGNRTRSITKKDRSLPFAGTSMEIKSWSTGDKTYMEGPPTGNATKSHVLYVRAFFNSTTMTSADHEKFDTQCTGMQMCSTEDVTLRQSSAYSPASTVKWVQRIDRGAIRETAGIVAGACSTLGVLALINIFLRRSPLRKIYRVVFKNRQPKSSGSSVSSSSQKDSSSEDRYRSSGSGTATPLPGYNSGTQTPAPGYSSGTHTPAPGYSSRNASLTNVHVADEIDVLPRIPERNSAFVEQGPNGQATLVDNNADDSKAFGMDKGKGIATEVTSVPTDPLTEKLQPVMEHIHLPMKPGDRVEPVTGAILASDLPQAAPKKRIDYLAGLVAVACIGVTLRHFCQTFLPWTITGYGPSAHWPKVERWTEIFVGAYAVTQLWIGPFFLTATRFLSTNYLKNGNLEDIAKKLLRRAPRLFVPIVIIFTLEYFFMEMGLLAALQELPSVSYSTWPYAVAPPNFGVYLNDLVQLAYLIPNAIPEVVSHYCIGVLWTVPIQLQFTYVVLVGAVLVRAVKTPWKRACLYAFAIICSWYARSWAGCHWCGLALSDLDATYKWKKYLDAHKLVKYLIMTLAFVGATGAPLTAVFANDWSFDTYENSIHPDFNTGLPILEATGPEYPDYFIPTLSILTFSIGLQILVELSGWVQAFLSLKPILWLHPHIMTIYLFHGFIFWAFGSAVCVGFWKVGLPYWACFILTLVLSYAVLFLVVSVLTPLINVPTEASMRLLDRWMKKDPVPKIDTIMPYQKTLVLNRPGVEAEARGEEVAVDEKIIEKTV